MRVKKPGEMKPRILEILHEYRKAGGVGSRALEKTLGRGRQWLDTRAVYSFDVEDLYRVLEALDVDPPEFFQAVHEGFFQEEFFQTVHGEDVRDLHEVVSKLGRRALGAATLGQSSRAAELWAVSGTEDHQAVAAGRIRLAGLDELRYTDAASVIQQIDAWLLSGDLPRCLIPEGLGVQGSAYRMDLEYDQAQGHMEQGLKYATEVRDYATAGGLYQRLSMVWWNRMDYAAALDENSRAIVCHEEAASRVGVARSMVDRGIFLGSSGLFQRSTDAFLRGLDELPETETETRGRATALQGVSHNLVELGELAAAVPYLQQAEQIKLDPRNDAKVKWFHGTVLSKTGHHQEGTEKLWEAVRVLRAIAPIDGALVMIDFTKALIRAGQVTDAHRAARMMHGFVGVLKHNKAAEAAATELAAIGRAGKKLARNKLTLALLENVRVRVSQAHSRKA